jgi:hypothetical protein
MIIVNIKFYFRKVIKTLQRVTLLNLVDHYTSHDISINQGLQGISPKRRLYYLLFMEPIDGSGININYKMTFKLSMASKKTRTWNIRSFKSRILLAFTILNSINICFKQNATIDSYNYTIVII